MNDLTYAAIIGLVILLILYIAWDQCVLNTILPHNLDNSACKKSGFVGAYGRTPAMQQCFFPQYKYDPQTGGLVADSRTPFNRCNWV